MSSHEHVFHQDAVYAPVSLVMCLHDEDQDSYPAALGTPYHSAAISMGTEPMGSTFKCVSTGGSQRQTSLNHTGVPHTGVTAPWRIVISHKWWYK